MARKRDTALQDAFKAAGGAAALAKALKLTKQAVWGWSRCPAERVLAVEAASGVPRQRLRPDIYPQ